MDDKAITVLKSLVELNERDAIDSVVLELEHAKELLKLLKPRTFLGGVIEGAIPVDPKDLEEFEKVMKEEVIPKIVKAIENRRNYNGKL